MKRVVLWLVVTIAVISLSGCLSTGGGNPGKSWSILAPSTWFAGRQAAKVEKQRTVLDTATQKSIKNAQLLVEETKEALKRAPESKPVQVATQSINLASDVLAQAV